MAGDRDIYGCDYFINQALALGVTEAEILTFKQYNTNADGSWDCNRLLDAFGGVREVAVGSTTQAAVETARALPPPVIAMATTSGDSRMFLTLSGVPDGSGSAAPARTLAQIAQSPIGRTPLGSSTSLFANPSGSSGMMTWILIAAIAGAVWYLTQK